MTRTSAKKQHYIPQFLLRNFATGPRKHARVWVLDKRDKSVRPASVRDVAHENRFYEIGDPSGHRLGLEDLLAHNDSNSARVIGTVLRSESLVLPEEDKLRLSLFVACQMCRTPKVRKDLENLFQMIVEKWGPDIRANGDNRPASEYGPDDAKLVSLAVVERDVPEFAALLLSHIWCLTEAPRDHPFVISDCPVVRYNMIDQPYRGNLGLKSPGIEVYLPISPRYCVHIVSPVYADLLSQTERLGVRSAKASGTGMSYPIEPESVEFVNSLQVIWAERFVFAHSQSHLEMPLDMLRTNPELMDGPGVRQQPGEDEST
jgi:hypothetical protein